MKPEIPELLKTEHQELHERLARATEAGGWTGDAAQAVAEIMHAHFEKEEEFALPPLGLLPKLARGEVAREMADVLTLTDKLKAELPQMLEEHQEIANALGKLAEAAKGEGKPEHAHFADQLKRHAQTEEEVSYPTAILIGDYLKLKLRR